MLFTWIDASVIGLKNILAISMTLYNDIKYRILYTYYFEKAIP